MKVRTQPLSVVICSVVAVLFGAPLIVLGIVQALTHGGVDGFLGAGCIVGGAAIVDLGVKGLRRRA